MDARFGSKVKIGKNERSENERGRGGGLRYRIYDVIERQDEGGSWTLWADNPVNRWPVLFIRSRVHFEMLLLSCCGFL